MALNLIPSATKPAPSATTANAALCAPVAIMPPILLPDFSKPFIFFSARLSPASSFLVSAPIVTQRRAASSKNAIDSAS